MFLFSGNYFKSPKVEVKVPSQKRTGTIGGRTKKGRIKKQQADLVRTWIKEK